VFIKSNKKCWSTQIPLETDGPLEEELLPVFVHQPASRMYDVINVERFGKFSKMCRAVAWIFRFMEMSLSKDKLSKKDRTPLAIILKRSGRQKRNEVYDKIPELNGDELQKAEFVLIRKSQSDSYGPDCQTLRKNGKVHPSSALKKLSPVLDENGIIRLKGRLENAPNLTSEFKRPAILNRHDAITKLILMSYHRKFQHQRNESIVNEVRQRFWIPDIRVAIKRTAAECQQCKNNTCTPVVPEMAALPAERVTGFERPFSYVGMDFFGPIMVAQGRSRVKRWGVIFTCLATRAVYLEVVQNMDSDSCVMAIRSLAARRGLPKIIRCDRGTNLVGAEKELRIALENLNTNEVMRNVQDYTPGHRKIVWKFNPGTAAHWGGSWERLIRCVKRVLYMMLEDKTPKENTLRHFLIEAEDILNSRPLTYRSVSPDEPESITPNHIIKLSGEINYAPGEFANEELSRKQWRISQSLANQFWKRWVEEYLP
jgi:hypothetical protein